MKIYGYARVSTQEQNTDRQILAMKESKADKIFIDKLSGKNTKRPELQRLMKTVKNGDTIIVESISRFARNTKDLLHLVEQLTRKGVNFVSLKESIDTTTSQGKFMLTVFGAFAELEREYILDRQAEGIAAAKMRGVKFGRPEKALPDGFGELVKKWERGHIKTAELVALCPFGRSTLYAKVKEYKLSSQKTK